MGIPLELDDIWLNRIKQSVNGLEFGHVQIIVHDGRIVQIERTERKRFDQNATGGTSAQARDKKTSEPKSSN